MTNSQNPPDGSGRQPSFTPHPQGGQPYQPQPYPHPQPPPGYGYPPGGPAPRRKRHILRNVLAGIGAIVVAVIIIAAVASSPASHTVTTTAGSSSPAGNAKAASPGSRTVSARTGTTITLTGNTPGEQMAVTVLKVIRHAVPASEFDAPDAGKRLYAVQFRLTDSGTAAYSDLSSVKWLSA